MELAGECPARRGRKEDEGQNGCTSSRERYWREESTRELTTVANRASDDGDIGCRSSPWWSCVRGATLNRRPGWREEAAVGDSPKGPLKNWGNPA
jgi:hypothetical protein